MGSDPEDINLDEKVSDEILPIVFEFFYKFSRFEFALKECGYLKSRLQGDIAEPDWNKFCQKYSSGYSITQAAQNLIEEHPKRQVVGPNGSLSFEDLVFKIEDTELKKVTLLLRAVRNNLFHGGKHGPDRWDDEKRMTTLVQLGSKILGELASISDIQGDYLGMY